MSETAVMGRLCVQERASERSSGFTDCNIEPWEFLEVKDQYISNYLFWEYRFIELTPSHKSQTERHHAW